MGPAMLGLSYSIVLASLRFVFSSIQANLAATDRRPGHPVFSAGNRLASDAADRRAAAKAAQVDGPALQVAGAAPPAAETASRAAGAGVEAPAADADTPEASRSPRPVVAAAEAAVDTAAAL